MSKLTELSHQKLKKRFSKYQILISRLLVLSHKIICSILQPYSLVALQSLQPMKQYQFTVRVSVCVKVILEGEGCHQPAEGNYIQQLCSYLPQRRNQCLAPSGKMRLRHTTCTTFLIIIILQSLGTAGLELSSSSKFS